MPGVSEPRPDSISNWGDESPAFEHDFVEPGADQQASGWLPSQEPPCEYHNWLFWNSQRWEKNLDDRSPRVRPYTWYVGGFSGAHFETLELALADASVLAGDSIYCDFNQVINLDAPIVVTKQRMKIFFAPGSGYNKNNVLAVNAFQMNASRIEVHGGLFNSFTDPGDCVFKLNSSGQYCLVDGARFQSSTTDEVDDSACPQYTAPSVRNTITE